MIKGKEKNMDILKKKATWLHRAVDKLFIEEIHIVKEIENDIESFCRWNAAEEGNIPCVLTEDGKLYISTEGKPYIYANMTCKGMFENMRNISVIDGLERLNTSFVVDMQHMFDTCGTDSWKVRILGLKDWNVSGVKDMSYMFYHCGMHSTDFTIDEISQWNVQERVQNSGFRDGTQCFNEPNWKL